MIKKPTYEELEQRVKELDRVAVEHKRTKENLRKSEEKYRSLFENIQNGFALHEMVFDEAGTPIDYIFLDVNEAFEKQTNLKKENLMGRKVTEVLPGIENDHFDWIGTYGKVVHTGNSISFESYSEPLKKWYSVVAYRPNEGQFAVLFIDITESKRIETALRESEENLTITLNSIGDAVIATDTEGHVIRMNPVAEQLTGWNLSEAKGRPVDEVFNIINEETRQRVESPIERVLRDGAVVGLANHTVLISKDGTEPPIDDSGAPITNDQGDITGVVLVFRDVSEKRRAEQALKIHMHDIGERVKELNYLFGLSKLIEKPDVPLGEILQGATDLIPPAWQYPEITCGRIRLEGREYLTENFHETTWKQTQDIIVHGETIGSVEVYYLQEKREIDEGPFLKEERSLIDTIAERLGRYLSRIQTEEALRESEEQYRRLVQNALVGIYQVSKEGGFITVNERMAEMFGYDSSEVFLKDIDDIAELYVHPEERPVILQEIDDLGFIKDKEVEFRKKGGGSFWVKLFTTRYRDKEKIIYEGLMEDVTEIKIVEKEKEKLESQLQQAHKMEAIGTLAGGIAHDFNNILSPIMIHSEMAMMELPSGSPLKQNMKEIYKAGERARDLVMQILTFARKQGKERIPIRISRIVKEAIKLLRSSIPTTIDIQYDFNSELDTVLSDPTQLNQIIMNLCTNAAHAMEENGGTLEVILNNENLDTESCDAFPDLEPGRYVKLTVRDTGDGIDPQFMDKIFEPYFTTKEVGKGTGMGLALVHGIVKSYGGAVTVQSVMGKGTSFHVYLPLVEDDADVLETAHDLVQHPTGSERILFVDDEKVAVDTMQSMLEKLGYKVTARTSSIEALEAFRNNPQGFDLVITDMTMPNMTGKELAKELMTLRSDIPIILCTGYSEKIDERRTEEMGISAFVMKPIVMREMANTIRDVLDSIIN